MRKRMRTRIRKRERKGEREREREREAGRETAKESEIERAREDAKLHPSYDEFRSHELKESVDTTRYVYHAWLTYIHVSRVLSWVMTHLSISHNPLIHGSCPPHYKTLINWHSCATSPVMSHVHSCEPKPMWQYTNHEWESWASTLIYPSNQWTH